MTVPLVDNIFAQPEALRTVASYQFREGRDALLRASALLRSGKQVILSGMGGSLSACIPLSCYLASKGVIAPVIETSELLHSCVPALNENTIVLLLSRSGESVEATKLLTLLRGRGVPVIGVTNVPGSTLAVNATHSVLINSPSDQLAAIQTYTGSIAVLLILGAAACGDFESGLDADLYTTADAIQGWIRECFEASETWTSFLNRDQPLYLLGRGPSLASVAAGVLLLHEVAKAPAVGMSAASFRHGPVEVVDDRFRSVMFASDANTTDLNAALAEDVNRMHGVMRWIGPPVPGRTLLPLCPWPANVPNRFASIVEIIPLQFAAYRLAESRGIAPGESRYAPVVTLSEAGFDTPSWV